MSDATEETDRGRRLDDRRSNLEGRPASRGGRGLATAAMVLVVGGAGVALLMPGQVQRLFGDEPSTAEEMQTASDEPMGISTEITIEPEPEPEEPVDTELAAAPIDADGLARARARIAELEARIAAIQAEGPPDASEIDELLQRQAERMDEQWKRERELLEEAFERDLRDARMIEPVPAGLFPAGGDADDAEAEAAARARLEEERARRAEIAERQIASDGIVLDASGRIAGSTTTGGGGDRGGGRELTSNEAFVEEASARSYDTVSATRIADPSRTIVQGSTLNATLETAIATELPGIIRAVISDDVYSYDGMTVLLPRGTRLIGSYNSDVSVVQDRVQLAWNRAVTPEGVSVELGGYGADELGRSGQAGRVDSRFRQRFGSAALISLLGAAPEVVVSGQASSSSQEVAEDLGGDLQNSSRSVVEDYLSVPPVIFVEQGTPLTVIVNRDLVF